MSKGIPFLCVANSARSQMAEGIACSFAPPGVKIWSAGTVLDAGDEIAAIETVKVNISLPSPVKGRVVEINSSLHESPELINQDPYGKGWIAVVQPENPDPDLSALMTAEAYLTSARQQAEAEMMS